MLGHIKSFPSLAKTCQINDNTLFQENRAVSYVSVNIPLPMPTLARTKEQLHTVCKDM